MRKNMINNQMKCATKTRKIAFFIGSLAGGGAERVVCNLANYLSANGYSVSIITMSDALDAYKVDRGVDRIFLLKSTERKNKLQDMMTRRKRLKEYILNNKDIDCYVAFLPTTIFLLTLMRKFIKGKVIISERNNPESYSLMERMMMKYAMKRCDGLVVQTKTIGEWYKNVKDKTVIQNAINDDVIFPERKVIRKKLVAVGRLSRQKNYPMMIEAFKRINRKYPDYTLEIYGTGNQEKKIAGLIRNAKLRDKVILKGYERDVHTSIADATCFMMTSNYEGMSNALIEAMCIGLPCVATDCDGGGAREIIKDGCNGSLVKKNDIDGFVDAVERIICDSEYAKKLSKNAKNIKIMLESDKIYFRWLKYIERIVTS